jgi:hypothetical protein
MSAKSPKSRENVYESEGIRDFRLRLVEIKWLVQYPETSFCLISRHCNSALGILELTLCALYIEVLYEGTIVRSGFVCTY